MKRWIFPHGRPLASILLLLMAGCGVGATLYATRLGGAMHPDSVIYVEAAQSLLDGGGYSTRAMNCISLNCSQESVPLTRYPPLFSALIAATAFVLALDPAEAARWINAVLHGTNSLLVAVAVLRFSGGSVPLSAFGALIMISSVVMLDIHTLIGSEPLFILLGLGSLLMIITYLGGGGRGWLAGGACVIALACLDRYVGAALVFTAVCGLMLSDRLPVSRRVRDSLFLCAVSTTPVAIFVARNFYVAGDAVNRRLLFSPLTADFLRAAMFTLSSWFFPGSDRFDLFPFQHLLTWTVTALVFAGLLLVGILLWQRSLERAGMVSWRSRLGHTPLLLLIFASSYVGLLILARCTIDTMVHLSNRHMACVFAACLILALYAVPSYFAATSPLRKTRLLLIIAAFGYAAVSLSAGAVWVSYCRENGRALTGTWWKSLEIGELLSGFPPDQPLFAADAETLYAAFLYSGRVACPIQAFELGKPEWIAGRTSAIEKQGGLFLRFDPPGRPPRTRSHDFLLGPTFPDVPKILARVGLRLEPLNVRPGIEVCRVILEAPQHTR